MAEIKVVIKEPKLTATTKVIEASEETLQSIIGDETEAIYVAPYVIDAGKDRHIIFVVDCVGKIKQLKPNISIPHYGEILMGTIIAVLVDEKTGTYIDMPASIAEATIEYMNNNSVKKEKHRYEDEDSSVTIYHRW